jgi:hypothetical protein
MRPPTTRFGFLAAHLRIISQNVDAFILLKYLVMIHFSLFSLQRLLLKYGWGVARSQRDEIERMVRCGTFVR